MKDESKACKKCKYADKDKKEDMPCLVCGVWSHDKFEPALPPIA